MLADRPTTCQALPSGSAMKRAPALDFSRNNSVCLPSLRASTIACERPQLAATLFGSIAVTTTRAPA
jgi:hypothetical protein